MSFAERLNREAGAAMTGDADDQIDILVPRRAGTTTPGDLHARQSKPFPTGVLWPRLDLLGDRECLRWISQPDSTDIKE